jgi:TetR/AcrR family transcriptional regulator, repressor for neighboring sulfatase
VEPPPVPPRWFGPVDDPEDTATKILLAAAELFEQHSPTQVSLRAIAARAGVNYGLVHHYFKTKEAILANLLRRASATGAARLAGSQTIDQALDQLVDVDLRSNYARMLAWAMLDETDPEQLVTASPAMAHFTAVIEDSLAEHHDATTDPKIVTAIAVSAVLGWQVFRPFITAAAELDDRDTQQVVAEVVAGIRSAVRAMVEDGEQ